MSYIVGAILIIAGACLLMNKRARAAATGLGLTILLTVLWIYLPMLLAAPLELVALNFFFDTLLFCGAILMLADAMGKKKLWRRLRTHLFCIALLCLAGVHVLASDRDAAQVSEGRATTRSGISIHYLQAGPSTSNRALVLIPGWRLPGYLWTEQLKSFSSVIRVVAVDPRSQGESTKTTEGNSPEVRARDLHDLLATLAVTRPILVGWSQGAQDVAAYVQQFGSDSVAGVVFVDSPVSIGPAEIEEHKEFSKIILSGIGVYAEHPDQYSRGMVESLFKQPHPDLDINRRRLSPARVAVTKRQLMHRTCERLFMSRCERTRFNKGD